MNIVTKSFIVYTKNMAIKSEMVIQNGIVIKYNYDNSINWNGHLDELTIHSYFDNTLHTSLPTMFSSVYLEKGGIPIYSTFRIVDSRGLNVSVPLTNEILTENGYKVEVVYGGRLIKTLPYGVGVRLSEKIHNLLENTFQIQLDKIRTGTIQYLLKHIYKRRDYRYMLLRDVVYKIYGCWLCGERTVSISDKSKQIKLTRIRSNIKRDIIFEDLKDTLFKHVTSKL